MTINQAKKLKWGTVLKPTGTACRELKEYREAIFLGLNRDKTSLRVVLMGVSTPYSYAPVFWDTKAEIKLWQTS